MSEQGNSVLGGLVSGWLASLEGRFYDPALLTELQGYAAASPSPAQVSVIYQLLANYQGMGMQVPQPLPDFRFPDDHGEHRDTAVEWRYYTCSLNLSDGSTFSIITNLRRTAVASGLTAPGVDPTLCQIYDSSIAWTWQPVGRDPVHHVIPNQTWWGGDPAITMNTSPFQFVVGPYSIISDGAGEDIFPLTLALEDDGDQTRPSLTFDLHCEATNPLFLQGMFGYVGVPPTDNGRADKSTYYYSWPQQQTTGQVTIGGTTLDVVSGITWLDHQWGGARAPATREQPGWNGWMWFEFQFEEGNRALTCSAIHGAVPDHRLPGQNSGFGTYVHNGYSTPVEVVVEVLDYVDSPRTDAQYPCDWLITVRSLGWTPGHWEGRRWVKNPLPAIYMVIKPQTVLRDQILWQVAMSTEYSEAAGVVSAAGVIDGKAVLLKGVCYCEGDEFETPANHTARCLALLRNWPKG